MAALSDGGARGLAALSDGDVRALERCAGAGGVAVIPTDTVYGLACAADSPAALARLHALKGRGQPKPAAILFGSLAAALDTLGDLPEPTRRALEALLPGPVTAVVADPRGRFAHASGERPTVGIRVPALAGPLAALRTLRVALAQSSANPTGGPDPARVADIAAPILAGADLVLDAGALSGRPSTVVDLHRLHRSGEWRILRPGALEAAVVAQRLGRAPADSASGPAAGEGVDSSP
ncbi:MAG TPA: L-threonylcarbamoyladenylate synthase [Solirubrobacteraceae bacterium]|nr:L-threonylcarbamoyladenylate synthase [Solirubrobacteraceae bacterium]